MINIQIPQLTEQKELLEQYLAKIAVQFPYFALTELDWSNDGCLNALIPIETPLGEEAGIITAAEAGRHLAILGSCAISCLNTRPGRHYYLAYQAHFFRDDTWAIFEESADYLYGRATNFKIISKREAQSTLEILTPQKNCIGKLSVNYHIVNSMTFDRIYQQYRTESTNQNRESPYQKREQLKNIHISNGQLKASLEVKAELCAGHFDYYLALPVARLMQNLIGAAGELLYVQLDYPNNFQYLVLDAQVSAKNLAFAGERIDMSVDYLENQGDYYKFHCVAITDSDKNVGELSLTIKLVNE